MFFVVFVISGVVPLEISVVVVLAITDEVVLCIFDVVVLGFYIVVVISTCIMPIVQMLISIVSHINNTMTHIVICILLSVSYLKFINYLFF